MYELRQTFENSHNKIKAKMAARRVGPLIEVAVADYITDHVGTEKLLLAPGGH